MTPKEQEIRRLEELLASIRGNSPISRARRTAIQRQIWALTWE